MPFHFLSTPLFHIAFAFADVIISLYAAFHIDIFFIDITPLMIIAVKE
jgi:hypothetical protein